jgi:transcription elongation factor
LYTRAIFTSVVVNWSLKEKYDSSFIDRIEVGYDLLQSKNFGTELQCVTTAISEPSDSKASNTMYVSYVQHKILSTSLIITGTPKHVYLRNKN